METGGVVTRLEMIDRKTGKPIVYEFVAYRTLTLEEMDARLRMYLSSRRNPRAKPRSPIRISVPSLP